MALITSQPKNPILHNHFTTLHSSIPQLNRSIVNLGSFSKNSKAIKVCNFNSKSRNFHLKNNPFNFNPQIVAKSNAAIGEVASLEPEESPLKHRKIFLSDVEVKRERNVFFGRQWSSLDIGTFGIVLAMHLLCLFAPFNFNWPAFWVAVGLYVVTGLFGITLSFHRNLSHKSFKLPKWLEYFCAYCGVLALQGNPIDWCGEPTNVGDLEKQSFYRFIRSTYIVHPFALGAFLYAIGGFPFLVWGMGVRSVWVYHITWFVNSACHVWGSQSWNTRDLSRNNWWVALLAFGEGWHNNHHAFEYSARHGLEWWEIDMTWYLVKFLQAIGLATEVKVPSESQKQRMALNNNDVVAT